MNEASPFESGLYWVQFTHDWLMGADGAPKPTVVLVNPNKEGQQHRMVLLPDHVAQRIRATILPVLQPGASKTKTHHLFDAS